MKQEKSCGAVVFKPSSDGGHRFLLVQHLGGHWGFPKGHVEGNETEEETALREIMEETGLPVKILPGFRQTVEYSPSPGCWKEVVYFLARADETLAHAQPEELIRLDWFTPEQLRKHLSYNNDLNVFRGALHFLSNYARYN